MSDAIEKIRWELSADEVLVWSGQPPLGVRLGIVDAVVIPLMVGLVVGGVLGMFSVFRNRDEEITGFWCVVVGVCLSVLRFAVVPKMNELTSYAVTNERILIASDFAGCRITSFDLSSLVNLSLTQHRSGGGLVVFGVSNSSAGVFHLADSAREVHDLIREAQRAAKKGGTVGGTPSLDRPLDERIRGERS